MTSAMRYLLLGAALVIGSGMVYALVVVGGELRHVSADLDALTGDMGALTEDVNSIADDVNAIADALAGEDEDDDTQSCPAPARASRAGSAPRTPLAATAIGHGPRTVVVRDAAHRPRRASGRWRLAW